MECKSLCHICLRTDRAPRVLDEVLSEFLDDISDFAIAISEDLPKYCSECELSLRQFYGFRQKCVEAIKILQRWKKTKPPNRKPINTLHTLLLKADSLCNQKSIKVYDVDKISTPEGKPNCASKPDILKIESDPGNNCLLSRQSDRNDGGSETNSKFEKQASGHLMIEQMKIKLESDDENDGEVTETLEYDARNSTTYVYEETAVKVENDDRNEDVNRDDYNGSDNDVVVVAENYLNNSNSIHLSDTGRHSQDDMITVSELDDNLSDTSLHSQDDITDSDIDEVDQQETSRQGYSDTSLNSDDDISDSEVFGEGRRKKIKMMNKTLLELTNIDITTDNDTSVNKAAKRPARRRKQPLSAEILKQELSSIFEHCKEVKSTDGTIVERDALFKNLVNLSTQSMRMLHNNIKSSVTYFTPKALDILAKIQKRFENKYDAIFDIEYLNTEEQVRAEFARRRTYESYVTAPYKCELCYRGFKYAGSLETHTRMYHDPSVGEHTCTVCRMRHDTKVSLGKHVLNKHRTVLRCKLCPLVTYNKIAMVKHANHHLGLQYKCSPCGVQFKSLTALRKHEMCSHDNEHICRFCARTFTRQIGLDFHRKRKHKGNDFPEDEGVPCDTCNITFISSQVYERHRRITHKEKESKSIQQKARRKYVRRCRGASRPLRVPCPACPAHGTSSYWLRHHLRAAHPERPPATPAHLCDVCGKGYASRDAVEQHRNVHTGARPYACDQCPAAFHTLESLTAHAPRHAPPQWHCKVCGKQFRSSPNLYNHMRAHVGDRRYKCEVCPAAFLHACALREHVRGVHFQQRRVRGGRRARTASDSAND